jgi:hypothetical protein
MMKRPARSRASRVIPHRPSQAGGGIPSPVGEGPGRADRPAPAADRPWAPWVGAALVTVLVMLAPLGGPCDRWGRRADPTTIGGPASDARPSSRDADSSDPLIAMYQAILDEEEEDGEGCKAEGLAGSPGLLPPPPPASLGAMDGAPRHDHTGRSARSPFLRC